MEQNVLSAAHQLRRRLGIPDDAERVLVFSESSHWDPNWMHTSEVYFERFVRPNLDQAIEELLREPRRIYSVECIFFLRMYWDRCAGQRSKVRQLVNDGRLRLTSSGITTADTLLPNGEAILRDFLMGQEWLRANGMVQEPRLAYFTDSFGCSPALPSLLRAAGFDRTAITRIDGMYFVGCDLESPRRYPRPGSSAERLLKGERTLDFVWRDRSGARVLCHWNAFTYGQGDMLAYRGISRVYLARLAISVRSGRHIARRIKRYVARLSPLTRTPYMLCPIGFDFVEPIPGLVGLLDRYNKNYYPSTGVWAVNAGLDDYLELVEEYQERLPVLELDPNPYWTGFYTSRPLLKQRCRRLVNDLLLAEKLSFLPENARAEKDIHRALEDAWWQAAVSNHHDFITGTSPDRVVEEEQLPWLAQATRSVHSVIARLGSSIAAPSVIGRPAEPLTWSRKDGRIHIRTRYYDVELSEDAGGAIVGLKSRDSGRSLLRGISNDLVCYRDSGGLWRMGLEFSGGIWKESSRASRLPGRVSIHEHPDGFEITSVAELEAQRYHRRIWFGNDCPAIYFRVEGTAPKGFSVTVRFETGISTRSLVMDAPGGIVVRPAKRIYDPTFWPLHSFVHLQDDDTRCVLSVFQPVPGAVCYEEDGQLELVAMRNAPREKAFGIIPIPGNPAEGHERGNYTYEYALLLAENSGWDIKSLYAMARDTSRSPWSDPRERALKARADSTFRTTPSDTWVGAIKPASRGEGIIVRIYSHELPETPVAIKPSYCKIRRAFLCDGRERDLEPLEVRDNGVHFLMPGTITTVRLVVEGEGEER